MKTNGIIHTKFETNGIVHTFRLSKLRSIKQQKVTKQKPAKHQRKKRVFECYLCLLKCRRIYELKAHLSIFHPVEQHREILTCPLCPKTTISREVLSRHLRKVNL